MNPETEGYIRARAEQKADEILRDEPENRKKRLANVGWHADALPSLYQLRIIVQAQVILAFAGK